MSKARPATESKQPWYHEGLRFECTGCGQCCTGAPGYVWVSAEEIERLAAVVGLGVAQFEEKYVRSVGKRKSLIEFPNGDCVFYDNRTKRCKVYGARPAQCRTWPFWESNVRTPRAWQETCQACPGCGQGPLIPVEKIEASVKVIKI